VFITGTPFQPNLIKHLMSTFSVVPL